KLEDSGIGTNCSAVVDDQVIRWRSMHQREIGGHQKRPRRDDQSVLRHQSRAIDYGAIIQIQNSSDLEHCPLIQVKGAIRYRKKRGETARTSGRKAQGRSLQCAIRAADKEAVCNAERRICKDCLVPHLEILRHETAIVKSATGVSQ